MSNTITIQGTPHEAERLAGGVIIPGHLVEITSSNTFVVHATADGAAVPVFALENAIVGRGVDDAYASGETVHAGYFPRGAVVYAWLEDGTAASIGDELSSNGAGALQKPTVDASLVTTAIVAKAEEAVTASGANARIKVRVV